MKWSSMWEAQCLPPRAVSVLSKCIGTWMPDTQVGFQPWGSPLPSDGTEEGQEDPKKVGPKLPWRSCPAVFPEAPETPGPCLGWSVPCLGLCTSAELGGLSKDRGERPGAGSTLRAENRLRAAACGALELPSTGAPSGSSLCPGSGVFETPARERPNWGAGTGVSFSP